jgi:phosphatidylglycerophosphate synthase
VSSAPAPGSATDPDGSPYRQALVSLSSAQKTAKGAPAYSRFVNRWLGRRIAARAFVLGMTPNQVTAVSACLTFSGILALALVPTSPWLGFAVALLLLLGYAFDSADGQLARLRGGGSPSGEWLDHVVDSAKTSTLHAAVLIGLYRFAELGSATPLLVPVAYAAVASTWFFVVWLTDQLRRTHHQAVGTPVVPPGAPAPVWRSLAVLPTDYGVLALAFVLWGWPPVFLVAYALLLLGTLGHLTLGLRSWFREIASFSDAAPDEGTRSS